MEHDLLQPTLERRGHLAVEDNELAAGRARWAQRLLEAVRKDGADRGAARLPGHRHPLARGDEVGEVEVE